MNNYAEKTMLLPDTLAISILMAEKELDSKELATRSGVGISTIYAIRRGCYAKPKYLGKVAKVLDCSVSDIIAIKEGHPVEYNPVNRNVLLTGVTEGA
jgi:DNA-binding Xre family transcriptional regulator